MRVSLTIVLVLFAIAFSNADEDRRCANGDHRRNCQPDSKPDDSSLETPGAGEDESPNAATELSAAKTPTSSSQQLSTTSPNSETTSTTQGNQTTQRQNSSSPSTTTATSPEPVSTGSKNSSNVYDESSSSSSPSSTTTIVTPTTEDIWDLLKPGINVLEGVTIYVCSESTTSTRTLPTTPQKSTTISTASTATTTASTSSTTSLKTPTLSSSSSSTTSPRKTSTSSDSTSSKSQMSSTRTLSTTSSTFTASQEKSTTPIPSKTASANIQTSTISHVSAETSSPSSSSTTTRSSLDSTGYSSISTESSSTSTQTTPVISSSSATPVPTAFLSTSPASTSSVQLSSPSSFSSSTSASTEAASDELESSSNTKSTRNEISTTSSKSSEASTSSGTDSTTLPTTTETASKSSESFSRPSELSTTEMRSTSSTETTSPASPELTSSSSSIRITTIASELTSLPSEEISGSSESSETSSKDTSTKSNAFPTTTSEPEATSESESTVLPATSSTSTVIKTTSSIKQSTMETSSVGIPSTTSAETPDTETRTAPKSLKTTPGNSETTTTRAKSTPTSSSITESSSSSMAPPRSSSSSATSSGTTGSATSSETASSSSTFTSSSFSTVTSSGTSRSSETDSTASSLSVSELTTAQSTPITQSVKSHITNTGENMGSSTPSNVKVNIDGSTSTIISTTAESSLTEEKISTPSAKPQPSTTSPNTSGMFTSEKSSSPHPTTTDSTTSMVSESSSSKNPMTSLDDGTTQTTSEESRTTPTTSELQKSTEASAVTTSAKAETSSRITPTTTSTIPTQSTPNSSSSMKPILETSKDIPQMSSTENTSSSVTTSSEPTTKSSTTSTSKKSTTPNPSTASKQTSTPKSTTTDPLCSQQCPDGYLIGTSYCFRLFPRLLSYQSALAYCKIVNRQTLASLDKIKDNSDIKLIQESAALQNIDWIYANGIGAKDERFLKKASVYSIYNQSLVSSPIVKIVGISQTFTNISALCVMPRKCNLFQIKKSVFPEYCETMTCDVEKIFQAYEFYNNFKQTAGTLDPRRSGTVTCIYGNQKATTVTCNTLGAIYPNPTNIDCEESATERELKDTTNDLVSDCKACYKRGTKECQKVMDQTNQEVKGYQCICKEPFSMSTCWRTVNNCNSTVCGDHGTCMSEMGHMWCDCKWGYTGDHCHEALDEKYDGDIGFSSAVGATITVGDGIFRFLKICVMGLPKGDGGFDPQSTHQTFRWVCILCANALITLYSNPTLLAIPLIQCRFTFIAIHFFYVQAMVQWLLEGFNVNQVLRCVHLNEWERDINGNKSLGVRIWPRFIVSVIGVAVFVLIPFTAGWNKLAASWTCVGVICQETLHVWFPIFFGVLVIVLWAGAVYENSALIKVRRPLLGFRLDYEIERRVGWEAGKIFQKCRDNELMCFIGVILLVAQWISVIISSDHRDEKFYGMVTVVVSGIYSAFSTYQEIMTNPEDRANFYTLLQRFLPYPAAPAYNPETTWTIDEVKEYFNTPKKEREEQYEGFINRNQQLFIHHKWDIRMNEFLVEDPKMTINEALIKVFTAEMNELKKNNGTGRDKLYIQATFVAYCDTIPHFEPRPTEKLEGHLELVTIAAEDPVQGTRLAKFFIVPTHHIFEPEIPEKKKNETESRKKKNLRRRMLKNIEEDIFKLTHEEIHAQAVFANSAILFSHYGNDVVR